MDLSRILIIGGTGQLGNELILTFNNNFILWSPNRHEFNIENLLLI